MNVTVTLEPLYSSWTNFFREKIYRNNTFVLMVLVMILSLTYFCRKRGKANVKRNSKIVIDKVFPMHRHFPLVKLPIFEGFYTLYSVQKDGLEAVTRWGAKHKESKGFQFYLGPVKLICVTDAEACHKILSSSNPGHLSKPQEIYGRIFISWLQKGVLNSDYDLWKTDRKILARSFTFRPLQSYVKIWNDYAKKLVKGWVDLTLKQGDIVRGNDLYHSLTLTLIGSIIEIILGKENCTQEDSSIFGDNFCLFKDLVLYRFLHPELFIPPIWWLHPKRMELDDVIQKLRDFIMKIIKRHEKKLESDYQYNSPLKGRNDQVDNCERKFEQKSLIESMLMQGASPENVFYEVGTILVAGHETTETGLNFLMLDLALNQHFQEKCREEVDSLFNSKHAASDFDLLMNLDDLSELKYLERCILESLRLTPIVPFFMRRVEAPLEIGNNVTIEAGENVLLPAWLIHRDPKHYPNPEKFDPDRFLPENMQKRVSGSYIPFSMGPRNCIGWKSAINQMKVLMAWILRNFVMTCSDKRNDVKLLFDGTIKPERNYDVVLRRRDIK